MKIGFCYGLFYDGYEDYEIYEGTAEGILGTAAWCPEAEHLAESSEIDFDNSAYLRVTLDSAEEVGLLLNKIQEIVTAKREEIIDLSTVSRDFRIAIKVNEQEVSFNRVINGKYTEDFFGSVSTEFYMLFLQALEII